MSTSGKHLYNILQVGEETHLWQFGNGGPEIKLMAEDRVPPGAVLPAKLAVKSWRALWQPKINIAWLPLERVFLRVLHLPATEPEELRPMVELQLEKISPMPLNQVLWSYDVLSSARSSMCTVLAVVAERSAVEGFLGTVEQAGYQPDRLEIPLLHQLAATTFGEEGAWIFPIAERGKEFCLVAWWGQDQLRTVNLLPLPPGEAGVSQLIASLRQVAWAAEMEGWLGPSPRWHLIGEPAALSAWEKGLREWAGDKLQVDPSMDVSRLAALTAERASGGQGRVNLLPDEYASRYRQSFVDYIWMRGLGAALALYVVGVLIFLGLLWVKSVQLDNVRQEVHSLGGAYTNALQLKARLNVLQEQRGLKFAALDCWRAVAEKLPPGLRLLQFNFQNGETLRLVGTAPPDSQSLITVFNAALSRYQVAGQPLFVKVNPAAYGMRGKVFWWNFTCKLKQAGTE